MSKPVKKKKKVVVTTGQKSKTKLKPTRSKSGSTVSQKLPSLIFGKENFKYIFIGLGLIALGFILMSGGSMPSPDVWDESLIYSHRRITLAPIVILAGLGIQIYAIFK